MSDQPCASSPPLLLTLQLLPLLLRPLCGVVWPQIPHFSAGQLQAELNLGVLAEGGYLEVPQMLPSPRVPPPQTAWSMCMVQTDLLQYAKH